MKFENFKNFKASKFKNFKNSKSSISQDFKNSRNHSFQEFKNSRIQGSKSLLLTGHPPPIYATKWPKWEDFGLSVGCGGPGVPGGAGWCTVMHGGARGCEAMNANVGHEHKCRTRAQM